jgi:hypothetical protein
MDSNMNPFESDYCNMAETRTFLKEIENILLAEGQITYKTR